jgi:lipoprotein-anchoring transpeptidase ErfK/SrfK
MAEDTSRRRTATLTREQETRRNARAERQRRENSRLRRDRIVLALVLVAIAAGGAFALRPGSARAPSASDPGGQATRTVEASATSETGGAAEPTAAPLATPATQTAEATAAPKPIKPLSPAPGVKTIVVDKSEQTVTLYKADGKPVDRFQCASGEVYPRVGTYTVWGHAKQSWSLTDDTTFYYFTKFATSDKDNSIGFHSIPEEPDGTLVGGLGKPVSAGCVRLAKDKARLVYTWAVTGTRVVVKR